MKIYTSYFYKIRFFTPNMIPLSTAVWDPKWYHDFKSQDHVFRDKNRVINGMRNDDFVPGELCKDDCRGITNCLTKDPNECDFLKHYRSQLDNLNISDVLNDLSELSEFIRDEYELTDDPEIVFIFHEDPSNKCSERWVVQQWFKDNGIDVEEWSN